LYGSTQFIREHNSEDSDFARFGLDPHFVATIPEWYSQYVAPSDGSTMEANAATMDVFRDKLATALALTWNTPTKTCNFWTWTCSAS